MLSDLENLLPAYVTAAIEYEHRFGEPLPRVMLEGMPIQDRIDILRSAIDSRNPIRADQ